MAENTGIEQVKDQVTDQVSNGNGSGASRLLSKEILIPAAATAGIAAAAGLAATKGPDLKNKIVGTAKDGAQQLGKAGAEGAKKEITGGGGPLGAIAGAAGKLLPGGGGGRGKGKKTRRLPIQRWTDVALPLDEVYEKWTNFEEYPKFMHRVLSVEQPEDDVVEWEEKIWFSKRQWKATITDNRKNDRIAWKTESGTNHTGIVSFHKLDAKLTRVMVTVDFQPTGMFEKMASGLRFVKRAVQADLARFKAYVELEDAEGVEYESVPEKQDDKKNEQKDEKDEQRNERSEGSSSNGSDDASDEERDAERKEREERRKERREALSTN